MFDFVFEHIVDDDGSLIIEEGVYIWVFHADKVPPHIGISQDQSFYSLKSSGVDLGLNTSKVLWLLRNKRIPSFLIHLKDSSIKNEIPKVFQSFNKTEAGKVTCLSPIKVILDMLSPQKLSELLAEMDMQGNILKVIRINGDSSLRGIRAYDPEKITERLMSLEKQLV